MNEEDLEDVRLIRQLGQEDDINDLDDNEDNYNSNRKQLKEDLLFAIQGFGGIQRVNKDGMKIDAYIKGRHCEASVKDICKVLKNDNPDSPLGRLLLAKYNIVETDLLDLFLTQTQDQKLSFWLVALMALLTASPSQQCLPEEKELLLGANRAYKKAFLRSKCLNTLIDHLADCFTTPQQHRKTAHEQLVQFIMVLIRNLLQIPNNDLDSAQLHEEFLVCMIREEMFDSLLFFIQSEESKLLRKLDMVLLEILFHTFTCFPPEKIFAGQKANIGCDTFRFRRYENVATRNSRFQPNFQYKSSTGAKKIIHKLMDPRTVDVTSNVHQQKKPVSRAKAAKVQSLKHSYIEENVTVSLSQLLLAAVEGYEGPMPAHQKMVEYSKQFLEVEFTKFVGMIFDAVYKEEPRVTQKHKIYYFLLCAWAIDMTRCKYQAAKESATDPHVRCMVEFDLSPIAQLMQFPHFELIYKTLYQEVTREKKKDFKVNTFNADLMLFTEYLRILTDMSVSMSMNDRKNSNALMAHMFRHDIAKVLKEGFYLAGSEEVIQNLVNICHIFFKLLGEYAKGKILTIQTNRLVKKKKKTKKEKLQQKEERELEGFIEKNSSSESDDGDYGKEGEDPEERKKRRQEKKEHAKRMEQEDDEQNDNPVFQERKYNEQSEFSVIAEYGIIHKYLEFLRNQRFLTNSPSLNESVFFFFNKIGDMLSAHWLFYQAQTLAIFHDVLSHVEFAMKHHKQLKCMRDTAARFMELVRINPLAIVEAMFKYQSLTVKDAILNNYQDYVVNENQ